jgi:hypothetical protein
MIALIVLLLSSSSIATLLINYLQPAHAQTFSNPVNLTNGPGDQTDPHIAASGTNAYLVMTSEEGGGSNILFSRSVDGGISYSPPTQLPSVGFSFLPSVAASGNNVYVSWTSVTTESDIFLITSTDGGLNFGSPVEVTIGDQSNARSSVVAAYGNNVYVAWQDFSVSTSTLDPEIFFAVSTDGGLSFSSPINISNTPGRLDRNPAIAAFEGNVYVVWTECAQNGTDCRIFFTKITDNGATFSIPAVALSNPESSLPDIAVIGNTVYVVYGQTFTTVEGSIARDVFLLTSLDGGITFGQPINLSNSLAGISQNPNIDVSGSNVGVTWEERDPFATSPHWEVFFRGSIDGGASFSSPISLSSSLGGTLDSTLNDIAVSGNNVYSTWTVFLNGSAEIFFASGTFQAVLIPAQAIQQLIDLAQSIGINTGPLHQAVALISDNNPNNDRAVCNQLDAFINQVNTNLQQQQGQIIPEQEANQLIQSAQSIKATIPACAS